MCQRSRRHLFSSASSSATMSRLRPPRLWHGTGPRNQVGKPSATGRWVGPATRVRPRRCPPCAPCLSWCAHGHRSHPHALAATTTGGTASGAPAAATAAAQCVATALALVASDAPSASAASARTGASARGGAGDGAAADGRGGRRRGVRVGVGGARGGVAVAGNRWWAVVGRPVGARGGRAGGTAAAAGAAGRAGGRPRAPAQMAAGRRQQRLGVGLRSHEKEKGKKKGRHPGAAPPGQAAASRQTHKQKKKGCLPVAIWQSSTPS